jgi:iron(III) transport system ATP-binding protein
MHRLTPSMSTANPQPSAFAVEVQHLSHRYGQQPVLDDLSLSVRPGEFVALLGPSGCGKSTLLRALAGLLKPETGRMRLLGQPVFDAALNLWVGPEHRGLGMVFQDYALWPHMSVAQNVGFPLQVRNTPASTRDARVQQALARVRLQDLAHRKPGELSGGQQQRVGLARAIVADPQVLLFDEPLSNLDAGLREALGREIATVVKSLQAAAIYVTHDRNEALGLADRIAVMRRGRIEQLDTPEQLYQRPASIEVAEFLQAGPMFDGQLQDRLFTPLAQNRAASAPAVALSNGPTAANGRVKLLIPHRAVQAVPNPALAPPGPLLDVRVERCWYAGEHYDLEGAWLQDQPLLRWRSPCAVPVNSVTQVGLNTEALHLYHADSGLLLS